MHATAAARAAGGAPDTRRTGGKSATPGAQAGKAQAFDRPNPFTFFKTHVLPQANIPMDRKLGHNAEDNETFLGRLLDDFENMIDNDPYMNDEMHRTERFRWNVKAEILSALTVALFPKVTAEHPTERQEKRGATKPTFLIDAMLSSTCCVDHLYFRLQDVSYICSTDTLRHAVQVMKRGTHVDRQAVRGVIFQAMAICTLHDAKHRSDRRRMRETLRGIFEGPDAYRHDEFQNV